MDNSPMKSLEYNFSLIIKKVLSFGTLIVTALYLADWLYALNFYGTLGVTNLAYSKFPLIPVSLPVVGSAILLIALEGVMWGVISAGGSLIILNFYLGKVTKKPLGRKERMLFWGWWTLFLFAAPLLASHTKAIDFSQITAEESINLFLSITSGTVSLWIGSRYFWKEKLRWIQNVIIGIIVVALFKFLIVDFSRALGVSNANDVLMGKSYLPPVAILIDQEIYVSDGVLTQKVNENLWEYYPKQTEIPLTNTYVPSLQLVGTDRTYMYLLDFQTKMVYSLSLNHIIEVVYLKASVDSLPVESASP